MAPTEILARQHGATLSALAKPAGVEVALLTGREKGKARETLLAAIRSGAAPIVVGTHAIFQEDVEFRDLGFAVIDEQHRFGVEQRAALTNKGKGVDLLAMTATPIPRTLMLAAYGDMDHSRLTEKPAGRKPVTTRTVPIARLDEVVAGVDRALAGRRQGLLDLPGHRRVRGGRSRRRIRARDVSEGALRAARRPGPRPHEGRGEGSDHGGLRPWRDRSPRRDHGDRGGRRRARRDGHGDRARRALRPGAAASAARPYRPRRQAPRPASCSTPSRSARRRSSASRSCARPTTASASPRRI